MKVFKEKLHDLETIIESITMSSESYTIPMKDKKGDSTFSIIRRLSQGVWTFDSKAIT